MCEEITRKVGLERKDFPFESRELLENSHYELGYKRPLIFRCFDSRLDPVFDAFLKENGWSHKDLVSIPGGARLLGSNDRAEAAAKQLLLGWCKASVALHKAKWVILTVHLHCGDYKRFATFVNDEAERKRQASDLEWAVRFVQEELGPEVFVEGRYVDGHGIHPVG